MSAAKKHVEQESKTPLLQNACLSFGAARRVLPAVIESLIFSSLDIFDIGAAFSCSRSLSERIASYLRSVRLIFVTHPRQSTRAPELPNAGLGVAANHCRSLVEVNSDWPSLPQSWYVAVCTRNKSTLRCITLPRGHDRWQQPLLNAFLTCTQLERLDMDATDTPDQAFIDALTPETLPRLRELSMRIMNYPGNGRLISTQALALMKRGELMISLCFLFCSNVVFCSVSVDRASVAEQCRQRAHPLPPSAQLSCSGETRVANRRLVSSWRPP